MNTQYKVGDLVKIVFSDYSAENLSPGSIHSIFTRFGDNIYLLGKYEDGTSQELPFREDWVTPVRLSSDDNAIRESQFRAIQEQMQKLEGMIQEILDNYTTPPPSTGVKPTKLEDL